MGSHGRFLGLAMMLFPFVAGAVAGQSAELLDSVSNDRPLTIGRAAALVGSVSGSLPAAASSNEAADQLRAIGFALPKKKSDQTITVGEYSFLVIQLLDLPAGALYSIFPGPHYAVRELESRQVLVPGTRPGSLISGQEALRILGMLVRAETTE